MAYTWPGWRNAGLIGEGSFGKVYRIEREEFGQVYEAALKVITIPASNADLRTAFDEGMDEESVTEYFRSFVEDIVAEFALMSKLKGNSNIVSYEDHMVVQHEGEIGWDILIRMELLTALPDYTAKHPLEESDIIRLGQDLARALELCRKEGIIHRDIKPENIFVSKNGDFKLGDFGVARVAEKTISAMSRKGTYNYMAPEVYKGQEYGYAADLYSLGLVLYRFLNDNRTPFLPPYPQRIQYSDKEQALNDRISGKPIPAPVHGGKRFQEVVLKACAFRPEDRYASAEELGRVLSDLLMEAGTAREEAARQEREAEKARLRAEETGTQEENLERTVSAFSTGSENVAHGHGQEVDTSREAAEAAREEAARQEREAEEARIRVESARQERKEADTQSQTEREQEELLEKTVSVFSGKKQVPVESTPGTEGSENQGHPGKADGNRSEGRIAPAKPDRKKPWYQEAWPGTLVLPVVVLIEYCFPSTTNSLLYRVSDAYPAGQGGSALLFGILSAIMAVLAILWKKMWEVQKGQKNFYAAGFGILTGVLFFLRGPIAVMSYKGWGFQMVTLQVANLWIGIVLGAILAFALDLWRNQMASKRDAAIPVLKLASYHCFYLAGFLWWWVLAGLYSRKIYYGDREGWWRMFTVYQFRYGAWTAGLVILFVSLAAAVVFKIVARKKA